MLPCSAYPLLLSVSTVYFHMFLLCLIFVNRNFCYCYGVSFLLLNKSWCISYIIIHSVVFLFYVCVCVYFCLRRLCRAPLALFYLFLWHIFKITFPIFLYRPKFAFMSRSFSVPPCPLLTFSFHIMEKQRNILRE